MSAGRPALRRGDRRVSTLVWAALVLAPLLAQAATFNVPIDTDADTKVYSLSPDNNFGNATTARVGTAESKVGGHLARPAALLASAFESAVGGVHRQCDAAPGHQRRLRADG